MSTLLGAVIGLGIAVAIGYGLYRGARVINLRTFFQWTGVALIFIAAGLLSHGIHEFIEAGWMTASRRWSACCDVVGLGSVGGAIGGGFDLLVERDPLSDVAISPTTACVRPID